MHGNPYEVDAELAGRQVDLIFDPLELTEVQVRLDGRERGIAVPQEIKRHVPPRAQPPPEKPVAPTGIDYLSLIQKRREQELQQRIDYRNLPTASDKNNNDDENEEMTA